LPEQKTEAEAAFREALRLHPDNAWALASLATFQMDCAGRPDLAMESYRAALRVQPDYAYARHQLALLLQEHGSAEDARALYEISVAGNPEDHWAWAQLGYLLLHRLDQPDAARAALTRATALAPEDAWGWSCLGLALIRTGAADEARAALERSVVLEPSQPATWTELGHLLSLDERDWAAAEAAFRKAADQLPEWSAPVIALSDLLVRQPGRADEAVGVLLDALGRTEGDALLWVQLGRLQRDWLGLSDESHAAFARAAALDPALADPGAPETER
jgi:tetratricopeptide (TPR) repeat protein